jgi:thiaminase (transcriptional activator TenA)
MVEISATRFVDRLWCDIASIYDAILKHPFLVGIRDGSLTEERFRYFILQDAIYLQSYAKALATIGGRGPSMAETEFFAGRAGRVIAVERGLHETLLHELKLDAEAVGGTEPSPTTLAYTSFILATTLSGSFLDGLAAVLPCYWIYWKVGNELSAEGSPNILYQRWIATYGSEEFGAAVHDVLRLVDRLGEGLRQEDELRVRRHVVRACRYEWMFWDAAWRLERWPEQSRAILPG